MFNNRGAQVVIIQACDVCFNKNNVLWYCCTCQEKLCDSCIVDHKRLRAARKHDVVSLERIRNQERSAPVFLCGLHRGEHVDFICEDCDVLICKLCLYKTHKQHSWTLLQEYRDKALQEIKGVNSQLVSYVPICSQALDANKNEHERLKTEISEIKNEIQFQKIKGIENFSKICDEHLAVLANMLEKENTRYKVVCNKIQSQSAIIESAIDLTQTVMDNGHPQRLLQATKDAKMTLQNVTIPEHPNLSSLKFVRGDIRQQTISKLVGTLHIDSNQGSDHQNTRYQGYAKHVHNRTAMERIKLSGCETITAIVPMGANRFWISVYRDRYLRLIDVKGNVIKTSIKVLGSSKGIGGGVWILDVKEYQRDLLLTCFAGNKIISMSSDGQYVSDFYSAYGYVRGFCITSDLHVLVRVQSRLEGTIHRLGSSKELLQEIDCGRNDQDFPLCYPYCVVSTADGNILYTENGKVVCVDRNGRKVFTWKGELEGGVKVKEFSPVSIAQDGQSIFITDYCNRNVYKLSMDGTCAICMFDESDGLTGPWGIAIDTSGKILVCE